MEGSSAIVIDKLDYRVVFGTAYIYAIPWVREEDFNRNRYRGLYYIRVAQYIFYDTIQLK